MALVVAGPAGAGPPEKKEARNPPASRDAAAVLRMAFNGDTEVGQLWQAANECVAAFNHNALHKVLTSSLTILRFSADCEAAKAKDLQLLLATLGTAPSAFGTPAQRFFEPFDVAAEPKHHAATKKHTCRGVPGAMLHRLARDPTCCIVLAGSLSKFFACFDTEGFTFTAKQSDALMLSEARAQLVQHHSGAAHRGGVDHVSGVLRLGAPAALLRAPSAASRSIRGGGGSSTTAVGDVAEVDEAAVAASEPALLARERDCAQREAAVAAAERALDERRRALEEEERAFLHRRGRQYQQAAQECSWSEVAAAAHLELGPQFPEAKRLLHELSSSSEESSKSKSARLRLEQGPSAAKPRPSSKGRRKLPDKLLLELPACVLQDNSFLSGLDLLAELARERNDTESAAESLRQLTSIAACCLRLSAEEIIGLRLLCAQQRVLIAERDGSRRRLQCTRGKMSTIVFDEEQQKALAGFDAAAACAVKRLRTLSAPPVQRAVSDAVGVSKRQLVAFCASPAGDVRRVPTAICRTCLPGCSTRS